MACFAITLTLFGCKESALKNERWNVVEGAFKNEPLNFDNRSLFRMVDRNGKILVRLTFDKNGKIDLPGINTPDLPASWELIDGKIVFIIDTIRFRYIYQQQDFDYFRKDSIQHDEDRVEAKEGVIGFADFGNSNTGYDLTNAVNVYQSPFDFSFSGDSLIMISETTTIKAVKDRTFENLLNGQ
jgi:hypothetical protein